MPTSRWINAASSAGVIKGGLLKPLAVMADVRLPEYPDVPTLKELGYASGKGLWSALYAPAKTPPDVLATIHKATVAALNSAPVQEAFKKQMIKPVPNASIADAKAWSDKEIAHWKHAGRDGEGREAGVTRQAADPSSS